MFSLFGFTIIRNDHLAELRRNRVAEAHELIHLGDQIIKRQTEMYHGAVAINHELAKGLALAKEQDATRT